MFGHVISPLKSWWFYCGAKWTDSYVIVLCGINKELEDRETKCWQRCYLLQLDNTDEISYFQLQLMFTSSEWGKNVITGTCLLVPDGLV